MFAECQTTDFTHHLLGLARARGGQIRRRARLTVNLNLDLSGSRFFRSDNRDVAAGERTTPDITGRVAGGEIVVEVAGTQIAMAHPADIPRAGIIVVDPAFVVGDAQHPAG